MRNLPAVAKPTLSMNPSRRKQLLGRCPGENSGTRVHTRTPTTRSSRAVRNKMRWTPSRCSTPCLLRNLCAMSPFAAEIGRRPTRKVLKRSYLVGRHDEGERAEVVSRRIQKIAARRAHRSVASGSDVDESRPRAQTLKLTARRRCRKTRQSRRAGLRESLRQNDNVKKYEVRSRKYEVTVGWVANSTRRACHLVPPVAHFVLLTSYFVLRTSYLPLYKNWGRPLSEPPPQVSRQRRSTRS